jgi:hypothetical protein
MATYSEPGSSAFTISIEGEERLVEALEALEEFHKEPGARAVMRKGVARIVREAKKESPADTGRLRSSIDGYLEIGDATFDLRVGSNVEYAPYMELGTGVFVGRSPHFPPAAALDGWARRHGFSSGYIVALIIGRRGGLEPREYLKKGLEKATDDVIDMIADYIDEVSKGK